MREIDLQPFTTLFIGGKGCIKPIKFLFFLALLLCMCSMGYAAVTVTPATGGTLICSSKAASGTAPGYTTLAPITISENNNADLNGAGSPSTDVIVLNAPAGWQFSTTLPTFGFTTGANVTAVSGTITASTLTVNITVSGIDGTDQVTISGLQVQAITTSASSGYIYASSVSGVAGIAAGISGTNFGSVSLTPPLVPSVTIAASPSGAVCTGFGVTFTPTPVNGGGSPIYQWTLNGTIVSTNNTYSNSALVTGNTVACTMTSSGSCLTSPSAGSNVITMTVNPSPLPVTGTAITCPGTVTTLSDATTPGTWSSSNTGVATVDGSGHVTGVSVGTAYITYTSGGCPAIANITVNYPPTAPSLSTTAASICNGGSVSISASGTPLPSVVLSQNFNSGLAPWTVDNTGSVGAYTASMWRSCGDGYTNENGTYHSPDNSGFAMANADTSVSTSYTSTRLISPSFSLVGYSGATLSFQEVYANWPSGDINVNVEISTDGGSSWNVLRNYVGASIGTFTTFQSQSFSLNAYLGQPNLMLRFYYYCHWGYYWGIDNVVVSGASSVVTPSWSPATYLFTDAGLTTPYSAGTSYSTVYIHPTTVGTTTAVTYTVSAVSPGCTVNSAAVVTVNPTPAALTGNLNVCVGSTTSLGETTTGGVWSSTNPGVATVNSSGLVTGIATGTATISYAFGTGCSATVVVTVNTSPAAISGPAGFCFGSTDSLFDVTAGGTWTSGNTSVATVGSSSGMVTSVAIGSSVITYSLGLGCTSTLTVNVNTVPVAISGPNHVCAGQSITLSDGSGSAAWSSSNTLVASVGSGTGSVTGISAGTVTISYSYGTGCGVAAIVTINPTPLAIIAPPAVCLNASVNLYDSTSGGTWSSGATGIVSIGSAGLATGAALGTATITYSLGLGCSATAILSVNPLPTAITGIMQVCAGQSVLLGDAVGGGSWNSSATSIANVGSGTVTGITPGTATISYSLGTGCLVSTVITVNPTPIAILGPSAVCVNSTINLYDSTAGGTWSSGSGLVAGIGSSGLVSGATAGTSVISYSLAFGCAATTIITVNPLPFAIVGPAQVCYSQSITMTDGATPGAWSSGTTSIATIGSATGVVSTVAAGSVTISYTLGTGCMVATMITVNPLSQITGSLFVCPGTSTILADSLAGGTWSTSATSIATVNSTAGTVTGISAGAATVSYVLPTGCTALAALTVNPLPAAITGSPAVCVGSSTTLSDGSSGGAWSSGTPSLATVASGSGSVSGIMAGSVIITYTLPTGCATNTLMTVTPLPAVLTGTMNVCVNGATTLVDSTVGGAWSSNDVSIATINASSGIVSGVTANTTTITYTLSTGCLAVAVVTVNPLPGDISGAGTVCAAATTTFSDGTINGTWSSGASSIATVGSSSGLVMGVSAGTAVISYTLGTGCATGQTITVNPLPNTISGAAGVCIGLTTPMTETSSPGTWSSSAPGTASVNSSGIVSGIAAGAANIIYTLPTGCAATHSIAVNTLPAAITGTTNVCQTLTTALNDATGFGTWSSGNTSIATVGPSTGTVTGVVAGSANITYKLSTGCLTYTPVVVNAPPPAITGTLAVCLGGNTTLSNGEAGGTWSSGSTGVASIGSISGNVTGMGTGTSVVNYTVSLGCTASAVVTVNPLPGITGPSGVCVGNGIPLTPSTSGGTWASSNTAMATVGSTGIVTGVAPGSVTIIYTLPTGCTGTKTIIVNANPSAITGTQSVCLGAATTLSDPSGGGIWSSGNTAVATIGTTGTGAVTGVATGTALITYTATGACIAVATVTVNGLPAPIAGANAFCAGSTSGLLDDTTGVRWTSSNTSVATVSLFTGLVSGIASGSVTITCTIPGTGCHVTLAMSVNPLPAAIGGTFTVCQGNTTTLTDATSLGTWSSGNVAVATVGSGSGIVTGIAAGTTSVSYMLGPGCFVKTTVTVNPLPNPIAGFADVCMGFPTTLSDGLTGGTWASGSASVATIGLSSGIVTGISTGTALITYTLPTGCNINTIVTVSISPAPITGATAICQGTGTTLNDATGGGVWSGSNASVAVGSGSGIVFGSTAGTATITYSPGSGCLATTIVTVYTVPTAITGTLAVCQGLTITLSDAIGGGTWSSSNSLVAAMGTSPGLVQEQVPQRLLILQEQVAQHWQLLPSIHCPHQ